MTTYSYSNQMPSQRPMGMALALVSAIVLSPLYVTRNNDIRRNSGFVLPVVLAVLIIAIKTTSSSSSSLLSEEQRGKRELFIGSSDPSWVFRMGGSSWGLAGLLVLLMLVLSWQDAVQHFLWK